jgi:hypothetical protein
MKDTGCTEDWRSLCEQASKERDPQKLLELIVQINRALAEPHQRSRTDEASFEINAALLPTIKSSQMISISTDSKRGFCRH